MLGKSEPNIFSQMVGLDGDLLVGFLRGGCSRGGDNWGTLRIPFGKIGVHLREDLGNHHPPYTNPRRWDDPSWLSHKFHEKICEASSSLKFHNFHHPFFSSFPDVQGLGGGNSKIFYLHPENWGNHSHFDEHIFQMG